MNRILFSLIAVAIATAGCQKTSKYAPNKFADTVFIQIREFQDRRLSDSLMPFLFSPNDAYRSDAARAFASIQDSSYVPSLSKLLLDDPVVEVRLAAAYALGQTKSQSSASFLFEAIRAEKDTTVLSEILEAYGKVCSSWALDFQPMAAAPRKGIAWSMYRSGLRDNTDSLMNIHAAMLLNEAMPVAMRLGAAHYFSRGAKNFTTIQSSLFRTAQRDVSADVRMAAVLALQKIGNDSSRIIAENILANDTDYRVRIGAIRTLQSFPFNQIKESLFPALQDENVNAGIAASEVISGITANESSDELISLARTAKNWRIQATLYDAAFRLTEDPQLIQEIKDLYSNATSPYQRSALLNALQYSISCAPFVREEFFNNSEPVIKLAAATSLVAMNYSQDFNATFKNEFAAFCIEAIQDGDPAAIGTIAAALMDTTLEYKTQFKNFEFLHEAADKLSLPKDYEALQPLLEVIAFFEDEKAPENLRNAYNHPINWSLVREIPKTQHAIINTTKGVITLQLFVEEAPGSVANFVELVSENYFNDKYFHRVVPNFVVQTGCNRGDGWGSEDYSIRSEFSGRRYKTGSVGMASAGKDTEGTQWFITHSPTPHLDGRYTLFAEVISGMEVVRQIEVGDKIINIDLK